MHSNEEVPAAMSPGKICQHDRISMHELHRVEEMLA